MLKAYKFRIYPNDKQKVSLTKQFGASRFVWNYFLDIRNRKYTETGQGMTYNQMASMLTEMKKKEEYAWLNDANSQSLQQTLMHLDTGFKRFFKNLAKYPNFKKKRSRQTLTVPQNFLLIGNHITIPKMKVPIRVFMHRNISGVVKSLTISMTPSGKYYTSILVEETNATSEKQTISPNTSVGVDMGLTSFLISSNGLQIDNPKNLKKSEKKLTKRQRRLSRKKKGSKNMEKARIKVAAVQEHISDQRNDFHNKVSDVLTREYDTICVEDLNVSGMMKNHHLAKSISDAGWSSFMTMLKAKAASRGKNIIEIDRFDPSSKLCSNCGNMKNDLKLSDRNYHCDVCGLAIDRDLNAAINIKRFGLIKSGIPTDSGKLKPVDRSANTLSLLEKEGIAQVHRLKQEAPCFS